MARLHGLSGEDGLVWNATIYFDHLTIDLGSDNKKIQGTIADITGKVIYTTIATDTQKVEVNTIDFAEGIYIVQIQAGEFIGTKKLVVVK